MLVWIAFALLTAAVLAAVLAPLARPAGGEEADAPPEAGTLAVYRDQLAEIEAERARGVIGPAEAEAARLEVSRRLLKSAAGSEREAPRAGGAVPQWAHQRIALGTAVAVPLLALGLYLAHGSPGMPSSPFAAHDDATRAQAEVADLVAKVEARLSKAPQDGKGWEVIAPVYLKLGRFRDAANAYANAARLQGESVKLLAGLAEASILGSDGIVTEEARTAYEKILKLEPGRVEARFWLAMAKEQDGRLTEALTDYSTLLKEAPPDAAYRPPLDMRIKEVSRRMATVASEPAGPTATDIEAAAKLGPEARAQMISAMVDGLAQRLKDNGKDLPGWRRLLNAYAVLGRRDDARAALAEARRNFDGDAQALSELSRLAATLGLGS
jgi:cytochrome c-type biogenesis protein CcmH